MEQNLERNVDDVDDDKGELVRHTSIQEVFAISFTRSPMQFVNVVFSYLLWLAPSFGGTDGHQTRQNVSIGNVNVLGGDSGDVQLCQHLASNSGFIVKMQGNGINLYGVFRNTYARNNTRRWWTRATLRKRTTRSESCFQSYWKSLRTAKATRS